MGLFSSDEETIVGTVVNRVIEDNMVPDTRLTALTHSIFKDENLVGYTKQQLLMGPYQKIERMYRYAASGAYHYGLPNAKIQSTSDGLSKIKPILDTLIGFPVTVEYAYFRPMNNYHLGWQEITTNYGYNYRTNELETLSAQKGSPVYLDDLVAVYAPVVEGAEPSATARGAFGESPKAGYTPVRRSRAESVGLGKYSVELTWEDGPVQGVQIHYVWEDANGVLQSESIFVDLSAYGRKDEYYQVRYHYDDATGKTHQEYWTYSPKEGLYPALDGTYLDTYTNPGSFFPFVIFRRNFKDRTASQYENTNEFKTTEKLLGYLGMDFKAMGESINENPDIDDVVQAAMIMAVPANTKNQVEREYLFEFFSNLYDQLPPQNTNTIGNITSLGYGTRESYSLRIQDADFKMYLSFDSVQRFVRAGNIGPVGTFTNSRGSSSIQNGNIPVPPGTTKYMRLRKQVTKTTYIELYIADLTLRYDIYDGESVVAKGGDDNLLIPIDRNIADRMVIFDREQLYYRSLHLVFNSAVEQEIKWYQTGVFKIIMVIVAIVITIFSYGSTSELIGAALAISGATLAAATILIMYIGSVVVGSVLKLVAKELGAEVAFVVAIVLAVYGASRAYNAGGIGQDAWANTLLSTSTGLTEAAAAEYAEMYDDVMRELDAFNDYADEKWKDLEEVSDQLQLKKLIDPFEFIGLQPMTLFGESPTSYFDRSVHAGNIGATCFDFVENFANISLTLPSIEETIGDTFYG